jgi:hypothetical protein
VNNDSAGETETSGVMSRLNTFGIAGPPSAQYLHNETIAAVAIAAVLAAKRRDLT